MFPIRFNFPFIKSDGSRTTIGDAISEGGGGSYTLPTASSETKGGIKIGSGLSMDGEVLNNSNPTPYSLPTAAADVLGGVKVGSGLSITDGVLSATGGGGGSTLYTHSMKLVKSTDSSMYIYVTIVSDRSTAYDFDSLRTYLMRNDDKTYFGHGSDGTQDFIGIAASASGIVGIKIIKKDTSTVIWGSNQITFTDNIF